MNKGFIFFAILLFNFNLVSAIIEDAEIYDKVVKVSLGEGSVFTDSIDFFNLGKKREFLIEKNLADDFVEIKNNFLMPGKNEFGSFEVLFKATKEGVYAGRFKIKASNEETIIPVVLIVKSKNLLFEPEFQIAPNSLKFNNGEIFVDVNYHNLKSVLDGALVRKEIFDLDGNSLFYEEKAVSVARNVPLNIREVFKFPENVEDGAYIAVVSISQGESYSASAEFVHVGEEILTSPVEEKDYSGFIFLGIIAFLLISVTLLSYYWNRRVLSEAKDWRTRVNLLRRAKFSDAARVLRKLKRQRIILDRAFEEHYISRNSYMSGVSEINSLMNKLRKKL